ncbi:7252_t:CDS:1, partial [Dentiscutata erythropus]
MSNFQLHDFIEKFKKWTSIHNIYSLKIIENIKNNKISDKILVDSLELLADSSIFKYYSIEVISELELHLRTLVSLIEVICKRDIRIRHDLRERIYNQLGKFAEIHFLSTEVNEQGFNKVFKPQYDDFNPPSKSTISPELANSNDSKIYKDGRRNYNIDFLLLHLRDTLHCMRDDENKFLEVWRRVKELLCMILGITPELIKMGISHCADLPINNGGVESLFKHLQRAFTWKYPISSWYYDWRTLLELHFNIQNFFQEYSLPMKYGESLLLECLWHCVSKCWSSPVYQSEFLTNKKQFVNILLGMEPLALPHSLWFGALDIAQELIAKTQKDSTLGICYYFALESLQKAPSSFIRFKVIEVLIKLSKRNKLFYKIINSDLENYKQSFESVKGLKSHHMIEAIREKSLHDEKLEDTNKSKNNVNDFKKKRKTDSLTSDHVIISIDDFILDIVTTELSCPVTFKISKNFQILSCYKHFISSETLQQIIDNKSQPTCPFCRKRIDLSSVINLPQSAIYQGIRNYLPEDNNIDIVQDHESSDEEIDISKLKSQQNFKRKRSNSTVRKFFKPPKFLHPSLRKANTAYKLGELDTAINALTEILEEYPTSYSLQCYRAK